MPEEPRPRRSGPTPPMGVVMIASEVAPWAKTGGLADVMSALPEALADLGHSVAVVVPRYRSVDPPQSESRSGRVMVGHRAFDARLVAVRQGPRRRVVFVDIPELFDRDGLYGAGGTDYPDNDVRFAALATAALDFAQDDREIARLDIIHAHDWQGGLAPALVRTRPQQWPRLARAGLVSTIHNLAYQGLFPRERVSGLGLDWSLFTLETGEFWGQFSFLKVGITTSDVITTVSPTYAAETQRPESGFGFDGVLRAHASRYLGILNGIDTRTWNPATDPLIPAHYDPGNLSGKQLCKRALLERMQLPLGDNAMGRPLIGMVSRLVAQKGLDLIRAASDDLLSLDASWVFVGSGHPAYEAWLKELAARHPSRVAVFIGFDEQLAHLVEAGADLFLMPSIFEPCGLNQMYSLRYGTVPVVRAVGGLDDTIQHYTPRARRANGFKFNEADPDALARAVRQATSVFSQRDAWRQLMRRGMSEDHSWATSAREYVKVYRRARRAATERQAD